MFRVFRTQKKRFASSGPHLPLMKRATQRCENLYDFNDESKKSHLMVVLVKKEGKKVPGGEKVLRNGLLI